MGQQIIKQPNGKYCLFSTIVDNITYYDLTQEEIVETWTESAKKGFERKVKIILEKLEAGKKPYYQFTMDFEEVIETIEVSHGRAEANKIRKLIKKLK